MIAITSFAINASTHSEYKSLEGNLESFVDLWNAAGGDKNGARCK